MEKLNLQKQSNLQAKHNQYGEYQSPKATFVSTSRDEKMNSCGKNAGNVFCRGCK